MEMGASGNGGEEAGWLQREDGVPGVNRGSEGKNSSRPVADRKERNSDVVGTSQWQNTQGFIIDSVVLGGEEEDSRLTQGVFLGDLASRNLSHRPQASTARMLHSLYHIVRQARAFVGQAGIRWNALLRCQGRICRTLISVQ